MSEVFMIVHNPRCSKSERALEILNERGIEPEIVDYMNDELSRSFVDKTLLALNLRPKDVIRPKELAEYAPGLDLENDEEVIAAILKHPVILQRPIVIKDEKALIARPPERVNELFE